MGKEQVMELLNGLNNKLVIFNKKYCFHFSGV